MNNQFLMELWVNDLQMKLIYYNETKFEISSHNTARYIDITYV